jgi:hypothetical protein
MEALGQYDFLSAFRAALEVAGMDADLVASPVPVTVFAPTNKVIQAQYPSPSFYVQYGWNDYVWIRIMSGYAWNDYVVCRSSNPFGLCTGKQSTTQKTRWVDLYFSLPTL